MADVAAPLAGCTIFSKLDLKKGYLQVLVAANDVPKTAIITPFRLFEFIRMPFGLKNAGMTFQRLMDSVRFHLSGRHSCRQLQFGRTSPPSEPGLLYTSE